MRYVAPFPAGVEVMTLAHLREMAPPGYLQAPQRPAFHVLILGTSGRASHTVDFCEYPIDQTRAVWVRPGQVQRFNIDDGATSGDLVLFQPDFLIPGTEAAALADDRFGPVGYELPQAARRGLGAARRALREEYARALRTAQSGDAVQSETLRHLLSVLILRLADTASVPVSARHPDGLHDRFRELLERDFAGAHDVNHYARALGYSTRTLSRATQAAAGQTPKQMIQQRIALEASRLLAHSDLPVSSIASELGFRDQSNFSTFFVRQTGIAPSELRRQQRR